MITRRTFLTGLGLSTAGLYFGYYAPAATKPTAEPTGKAGPKPNPKQPAVGDTVPGLKPNVFIHVDSTGLVSIVCHRSEMGQGIRSSLPVLLADELGADMKHVKIVQADGDQMYGDQNTDGSNSVRGFYEDMRKVAATARMMLITAAAAQLNVPEDRLNTFDGFVIDKKSRRKISFGELAVKAGDLPIPQPATVKLRPESEFRHIGKRLPLLDGPAYVQGTSVFGADVRLPDMLIAVIARPATVGATIDKYDKEAALKVAGVKHVITMPAPVAPYGFQPWGGVAVVAENTWAAIQGREALGATWKESANSKYDSKTFRESLEKSVQSKGEILRNVGDVENAFKSATKTIEADYYVPHLPHVSMEPPVALAVYKNDGGGSCEVWAPTQNPQAARTEVARALSIPEERVAVHVTMLGGGFGRKSKADFCSEAAYLAKTIGVPVRVQFTRTDDIHHDYLNTVSVQKLTAALDDKGKVTAWRHRTAFPPIGSTFSLKAKSPQLGDLQQGVLDVALDIPNVRAESFEADAHVRIGWLRSVYNIFHAFAINSFIDEIAHAKKMDPREVMLEIYGPARTLSLKDLGVASLSNYGSTLEKHPVDAGRLRGVIERATQMANWKYRGKKKGRALGLAAHRSFNSYASVVASATKDERGHIYIDEVWIAIDPAFILNPDRVRAQMEGSVINGVSHLLHGGVTHKNGVVEQNNFDGVNLVRMAEVPKKINVAIITSKNAPGGVGEPGLPPVAPAVANAIFALTGQRIREFGLGNSSLSVQ